MKNPKSPGNSPTRNRRPSSHSGSSTNEGPSAEDVAALAVDIWKVAERARAEHANDRVIAACERAEDRLRRMGFEVDAMVGKSYDTNLKVRVMDHDPAEGPTIIGHCISPAVFYRGSLIREAEVVTRGELEAK